MSNTPTNGPHPEFDGFFANLRAGRLAFPCCRSCTRFHWYPMPLCPHCRGRDIAWQPVSGRGEIVSFTRVMHPFDAALAGRVPYVVALVAFADAPGVWLVTNIAGDSARGLQVGQPVIPEFGIPEFGTGGNGLPIVEFKPA